MFGECCDLVEDRRCVVSVGFDCKSSNEAQRRGEDSGVRNVRMPLTTSKDLEDFALVLENAGQLG